MCQTVLYLTADDFRMRVCFVLQAESCPTELERDNEEEKGLQNFSFILHGVKNLCLEMPVFGGERGLIVQILGHLGNGTQYSERIMVS